jgi:hypothetical protein
MGFSKMNLMKFNEIRWAKITENCSDFAPPAILFGRACREVSQLIRPGYVSDRRVPL